jgi:inner membrane protein
MASVGHIVVGMAGAKLYRRRQRSRLTLPAAMLFWSALSMLPDVDVIGFAFGVRYADPWGHRGATHSFVFAVIVACVVSVAAPRFGASRLRSGVAAFLVVASHGVLDTFTDGGLGCALWWPFDLTRYFAPWRPIPVAPIGRAYFSSRGFGVATTEALLFLPLVIYALWPGRNHFDGRRGT